MSTKNRAPSPSNAPDLASSAIEGMLGPNPFIGVRGVDLFGAAARLASQSLTMPTLMMKQQSRFSQDLVDALLGKADLRPEPSDKRFTDEAWKTNPAYRTVLQAHLVWKKALADLVEQTELTKTEKEQANFVVSLFTDAMSPTNSLLGNPAALKKLVDTGGRSVLDGVRNLVRDVRTNGGMPSQTDMSAFEVGKTLGVTPGAVIFRSAMLELIQYRASTPTVYARPMLLVPPQVNKFYILDLAPGKSIVEFLVASGISVYVVSWRNPTAAQRDWGMDTYVEALIEAIGVVTAVSKSKDVHLAGACSGAMTMAALLGHLAARKQATIKTATLMVSVLDSRAESQLGLFATPAAIDAAKRASQTKGVIEGAEMARVFAWMRPNDLVWNYWVNNYLMGNDSPVFDILFWNNDTTRLPARFHGQLIDLFVDNALTTAGGFEVLGTPVDLTQVICDKYLVAGITDHITPWKGVYNAARNFGGNNRFVLSSSGHIQSLVNPSGNPKSRFWTNDDVAVEPDEWLGTSTPTADTWWHDWALWLAKRSGSRRKAPLHVGSREYPGTERAPGTYVHER